MRPVTAALTALFVPAFAAAIVYAFWLGAGGDWTLFNVLFAIGAILLYVEGNK